MPMYSKVIADSLNRETGDRLTTIELLCPGPIWVEWLTHRLLSRNAGSGRAVPIKRFRETVLADPYRPTVWHKAQKGMGANVELDGCGPEDASRQWELGLMQAASVHEQLERIGVCKKETNNILRPWVMVPAVVSATEWKNFIMLRCNQATVEPDMYRMAEQTRVAMDLSTPRVLGRGQWHLPYVTPEDRAHPWSAIDLCRLSAGRCAGVSFFRHGVEREAQEAIALCRETLEKNGHWSPLEHQAVALPERVMVANFVGWMQFRKYFPNEAGGDAEARPMRSETARINYVGYNPILNQVIS